MEDTTGGDASDQTVEVQSQKTESEETVEIITKTTSVSVQSESSHKESSTMTSQKVEFHEEDMEVEPVVEEMIIEEKVVEKDDEMKELPEENPPVDEPIVEEAAESKEEIIEEKIEESSSTDVQASEKPEEVVAEESKQEESKPEIQEEKVPEIENDIKESDDKVEKEEKKNKEENAEIKEENLKTQLNEIIQEIDLDIEMEESGPRHHTWQPKGVYEMDKTEVLYEDVVPLDVPDVQVQERPKSQPPQESEDGGQPPQVAMRKKIEDGSNLQGVQRPTTLKVLRNSLMNGEVISPMEIPEGIPLLAKILPRGENDEDKEMIPLERLFTPATDWEEIMPQKKKTFASSCFYRPDHPTIDDQVELAHKISVSLVDENNKTSRGQSMYIKRKNKSAKWIHGAAAQFDEDYQPPQPSMEKPALKLLMKSSDIAQEFSSVQQHYEEVLSSSQALQHISSMEVGKEIATNLQSPTGKGAALFAKRKKRMDKFIVDETTVQQQQQLPPSAACDEIATASTTTVNFQSKQESTSSSFSSQQQQMNIQDSQQQQANPPPQPNSNSQSGLKLPDLTNILTKPLPLQKKKTTLEARGISSQKTVEKKKEQGFQVQSLPAPPTRKNKMGSKAQQIPKDIPKYYSASVSAGEQVLTNGFDAAPPQDPLAHLRPGSPPVFMALNGVSDQQSSSLSSTFQQTKFNNESANFNDGGAIYTAEVKVVQQSSAIPPSPILSFEVPTERSVLEELPRSDDADKRKSFNLAPKGWGTYNAYYTPVHLGAR